MSSSSAQSKSHLELSPVFRVVNQNLRIWNPSLLHWWHARLVQWGLTAYLIIPRRLDYCNALQVARSTMATLQ